MDGKKAATYTKSVNQQLGRLDRYDEYKDIILDKLTEIADTLEDTALKKLVSSVDLNAEDNGLDLVKQSLAYICENYRVERKVIRNRRQLITEKMAKRTLCEIPYAPLSANENYNEIAAIQNTLAITYLKTVTAMRNMLLKQQSLCFLRSLAARGHLRKCFLL